MMSIEKTQAVQESVKGCATSFRQVSESVEVQQARYRLSNSIGGLVRAWRDEGGDYQKTVIANESIERSVDALISAVIVHVHSANSAKLELDR